MKDKSKYHSVEFSVKGLPVAYQFRLWNNNSREMSILVRKDSAILPRLKVGDRLKMEYYPTDPHRPKEGKETAITEIAGDEQGTLVGMPLDKLELLEPGKLMQKFGGETRPAAGISYETAMDTDATTMSERATTMSKRAAFMTPELTEKASRRCNDRGEPRQQRGCDRGCAFGDS